MNLINTCWIHLLIVFFISPRTTYVQSRALDPGHEGELNRMSVLIQFTVSFLLLFSHSVMPDPLWPHGLRHFRLPSPSPSPRTSSNSCPLSHTTISSSVFPFTSCLQSFPALGSFQMSQRFASGGQSIGASASVSMNILDWLLSGLTGLISLGLLGISKGLSRVLSNTTAQKHKFFNAQPYLWSNSHIKRWLLEKP